MDNERERLRQQAVDIFLDLEECPDGAAEQEACAAFLARGDAERSAYASVARTWAAAHPAPRHRQRGVPAVLVLAVALLAGVLLGPEAMLWHRSDYSTEASAPRHFTATSGDLLYLDASSAIDEQFDANRRTLVLLEGAAYFETVQDARPFLVEADGLTARAIGTAFVVERSNGVSVAVAKGQVEATRDGQRFMLSAGEKIHILPDGRVVRTDIVPATIAAWRGNQAITKNTPLSELAATLDRRFRGRIVITDRNLAAARVSGVFSLADPIATLRLAASLHGGAVTAAPFLAVVSPDGSLFDLQTPD
ncbi:FecR domain-containing protein [Nisaea sp.]|uniref:FecR family protein n=1 Tax=Nisaea sp. TaxID=2024842 RepID=UPI00329957CE